MANNHLDHYEGIVYETDNAPGLFTHYFHFLLHSSSPYLGPGRATTGALTERIIRTLDTSRNDGWN